MSVTLDEDVNVVTHGRRDRVKWRCLHIPHHSFESDDSPPSDVRVPGPFVPKDKEDAGIYRLTQKKTGSQSL